MDQDDHARMASVTGPRLMTVLYRPEQKGQRLMMMTICYGKCGVSWQPTLGVSPAKRKEKDCGLKPLLFIYFLCELVLHASFGELC